MFTRFMKWITSDKKKLIMAVFGIFLLILAVDRWYWSRPYSPGKDELALRIQLDTKEDVGLLVYDYYMDGRQHSGGMSNADGSLIKHDEQLFVVWNRNDEEMQITADSVDLWIRFRIITEYVTPNFENVYPEEITRYLEPLSWKAEFGKAYDITITGDKDNGYVATLN